MHSRGDIVFRAHCPKNIQGVITTVDFAHNFGQFYVDFGSDNPRTDWYRADQIKNIDERY